MKCDKIKLEIANANRKLKQDEDSFKKQIEEINNILVNKDTESQVIEKKKDIITTSKTDTETSIKNVSKSNKFAIYEEEIVKNKNLKSKNLDLNKKFKIMQELVMKK